ncbi:protein PDC2-like [Pogonomyrmex barbatus]|uniref:Protein PDC2-like n=1 Tax=Pogonomyrmex barbatus TaxID=144034 RepID=A0A8N1S4L9_9HYME|nr:protein PDC2-like [Pogonomyrmex barbatus]
MSWKQHVDREATIMKMIKDDLLRWTCERHATDCPLDRHLLRDKALELASKHGLADFNCSEKWLSSFLKKYGLSLNLKEFSGSIFNNYRLWIDMMRSVITQYKHKDLLHVDELTMYSDVSPEILASTIQQNVPDTTLKKTTALLCCNASGTEKLPLLICGSYPALITGPDHVYAHSEDASINDGLFREWLTRLNRCMSSNDRRILLLLQRNRIGAFRDLELSHIRHIFFPDNFPPLLRPLKRDIFHFVKMAYRKRYVEGIRERRRQWNAENVVRSLVEAWREVPRDLIIASFQRTGFRTDDCFLEIHCNAWKDLETGISFRKFVTFDDNLSTRTSRKQHVSNDKNHSYNLRARKTVKLIDDQQNFTRIDSREKDLIVDHAEININLREIYVERDVDWKRKNPLKRSHDEAQLDEDLYKEAKSSDESTSRENEDNVVISTSTKVIDIQTIEDVPQSSFKSDDVHSMQMSVNESRTDAEYDCKLDKTVSNEERRKNSQALSNERSIRSLSKINNANGNASQQVFDDTSAEDSDTKESNRGVVSCATPRDEIESADLDGNVGHSPQRSLKRRRSRFLDAEESGNNSNDGESEQKRSKSDSNWTRQYETRFVFGPSDLARTVTTVSAEIHSDNGVSQQRPRPTCETERSIFTIRPRRD